MCILRGWLAIDWIPSSDRRTSCAAIDHSSLCDLFLILFLGFILFIPCLDVPSLLFFCVHVFSLDEGSTSRLWRLGVQVVEEGMLEIAFKTQFVSVLLCRASI